MCTAPSAPFLLASNPILGSACLTTQHALRTFPRSSQQQSPRDKATKLDEGAAANEAAPPAPGATIELRPGGDGYCLGGRAHLQVCTLLPAGQQCPGSAGRHATAGWQCTVRPARPSAPPYDACPASLPTRPLLQRALCCLRLCSTALPRELIPDKAGSTALNAVPAVQATMPHCRSCCTTP